MTVSPLATWKRTERGQPCAAPVDQPTAFGALLRDLRIRADLSQSTLARLAEINPAYVNGLERGTRTSLPRRTVVLRLATVLGAGPDDIDRLLVAADRCPQSVIDAGGWDEYCSEIIAGNVRALEAKCDLYRAEIGRLSHQLVALQLRSRP